MFYTTRKFKELGSLDSFYYRFPRIPKLLVTRNISIETYTTACILVDLQLLTENTFLQVLH